MRHLLLLLIFPSSLVFAQATVEDYKGKVVYLDFWASWCTPCLASFPWLNEMHEKYKDKNFSVVAVNLDKKRELAEGFLKKQPAKFPIIYDEAGSLAKKYEVEGMPYSIILDKDGKVLHRHTGFSSSQTKKYEEHIERALRN